MAGRPTEHLIERRSEMRLHYWTVALATLVLAFILAPIGTARAAGPLDGIYVLATANADLDYRETSIGVVIQNGNAVALVNLYGDDSWDFGIGTFTSAEAVAGTLYQPDGTAYGTFEITFSGGTAFTGVATFGGYVFGLKAVRVF
jgi:hypothetical protein